MNQVMRTVRLRIEGRVQGVGYRTFVERLARANAIDGFVRNRRDGGVEAVLHGPPDVIATLVAQCRKGPRGARIDWLEVLDEETPVPSGFEIARTV